MCLQVAVSSSATPNPQEEAMYASPEELLSGGATVSPKSDVYSLGVLFFELFNPVSDDVERDRALQALRHRILPPHVLQVRPVGEGSCDTNASCWEILSPFVISVIPRPV